MNLTGELRTPHYPHQYYPEHWGPFELHTVFPISRELRALEVHYYQICVVFPGNTLFLGFDDFTHGWPADRELSPRSQKRRDAIRGRAEYRALVKVKKVKDLSPEGVEQLRDAGADVSDEACREGLWVAVYGPYRNFPEYTPDPKATKLIQVQIIHRFEEHTAERNLHLCSIDQRTFARCMLFIERIKLRTFMINTSREDNFRTPIEQRDVEWFIAKLIQQHPFNTAHLPEKQDNYRGARKHTSEARHTFVCHAEWMLKHSTLHRGPDRVISTSALTRWAETAPAMRELAAQDGRAGWGVWDYVWDKVDPLEWYTKETARLRHYLNRIKLDNDADHDNNRQGRASGGPRRTIKSKGKTTPSEKGRARALDKGKGRAKTDEDYVHRWIKKSNSDDEASLDDEPTERSKRPRTGSSPSLGGSQQFWRRGSSLSLGGNRGEDLLPPQSSQSLGGWSSQRPSGSGAGASWSGAGPSTPRGTARLSSQSGPSKLPDSQTGLSRWAGAGLGRSVSSHSGTAASRSSARTGSEFSARFIDDRLISAGGSSLHLASPGQGPGSLETRLSQLSTAPRAALAADIIIISSDDEDMAEPGPSHNTRTAPPPSSPSSFPAPRFIEIHDSTSEDDQPMQDPEEEIDELQEDDAGPGDPDSEGSDEKPPAPSSQRFRTVISETPSQSRVTRTSRLPSHPLNTMSEEEISDSQESRNSSDSESKYGRKDRRAPPAHEALEKRRLMELNEKIHKFAPMVYYFPELPLNWSSWRCTCPPLTMPLSTDRATAGRYQCDFSLDLLHPSPEVLALLSASPLPTDAEFLKHLTTKPCVFNGPHEELPAAIFARIVELHREKHFNKWGVRMIVKETGNGSRRVYFELLQPSQ